MRTFLNVDTHRRAEADRSEKSENIFGSPLGTDFIRSIGTENKKTEDRV